MPLSSIRGRQVRPLSRKSGRELLGLRQRCASRKRTVMSYTPVADQAFLYPPFRYADGTFSRAISPAKLAYRGVLIERPCVNCDTVDIHFDGRCNSGPCQALFEDGVCGVHRFGSRSELNHDRQYMHDWKAPTYYPADIEWPGLPSLDIDGYPVFDNPTYQARQAFHALLDCVRQIGWPEYFTIDLFRDYQKIASKGRYEGEPPPRRFAWAVRSAGTDLFTPEYGIRQRVSSEERFFLYDGQPHGPLGRFVECGEADARAMLAMWRRQDLAPIQRPCLRCGRFLGEHATEITQGQARLFCSGGGLADFSVPSYAG
jgi:hypothetical protein